MSWTQYGPTQIYWAYTATTIAGQHYEPDYGPFYELHGPLYRLG